ncbi:TPA: DNA-packaging protein [Streptococcus suis]|nr:DNA-packaging protein [Streptococcus suis]HEM6093468.1 DNA-packaging protein [Streptococcus suis]
MVVPKFRAWVEAEETMHPVLSLDWSGIDDDLTVFVPMGRSSSRAVSIDNAILMQSTGLFDVNGKEIFEGDVIRVNYTDDDSPWTDAIIWSPKDCAWYLKSNKELLGFAMDEPDIIVEVIGNIYENPELVEEK